MLEHPVNLKNCPPALRLTSLMSFILKTLDKLLDIMYDTLAHSTTHRDQYICAEIMLTRFMTCHRQRLFLTTTTKYF